MQRHYESAEGDRGSMMRLVGWSMGDLHGMGL